VILHLVTDRHRLSNRGTFEDEQRCLLQQAEHAVAAGVDCIMVRERDLEARDLADLTKAIVERTRGTRTKVVVNDRVDVALASGADGVHLRAGSIAPEVVRRMTPAGFLVGRSVHSAGEAAALSGVDYLIAGTVWASASKPESHRLLGLHGFADVVNAVRVPVLAIGGVTIDRVRDVGLAGGAGIAAIGLFIGDGPEQQCHAVQLEAIATRARSRFDTSGSGS
jgi:thiamine-phosphate pyrophosphorylase